MFRPDVRMNKRANVVQRNVEPPSCNDCCNGKAISIKYSECVFVALCIKHTMRERRIILTSVACPDPHIFTFYLINGTILKKKKIIHHRMYEGWNFNSGNYLFTTDTK